jgi:site-specific recombinase XerD
MAALPPVNPHMLRHGCGFFMINNGHDIRAIQIYLGHASITNTTIYTKLNEKQFVGMWE